MKKLWLYFKEEEKRECEKEFAERLEKEKYDDFDDVIKEVEKRALADV